VGAKVYLAGLGHNFDVESWKLFADLVLAGDNVYAETYRNPYGPLWAYACAGLRLVQIHILGSDSLAVFHRLLALLLAAADVAIGYLLARRHSLGAGIFFLLNPVSLLITGFHTQFGNLAVLFALVAAIVLDSLRQGYFLAQRLGAWILLGVSLATKHILVFLPLWFLLRGGQTRRDRLWCFLPFLVFGLSFLPFVLDERGLEGVIEHVFLYESFHLEGLFPRTLGLAIPAAVFDTLLGWVPVFSGVKFLWLLAMVAVGIVSRERTHEEQVFLYLVAMLVFSTAMADQYLAIPLAAVAVHWKRVLAWIYVAASALYLSGSEANIGMLSGLSGYAQTVRGIGLQRWHPVIVLAVLLLLNLRAVRRRKETLQELG
jgi:hypothetical protein